MSGLIIYQYQSTSNGLQITNQTHHHDGADIAAQLAPLGILFERWQVGAALSVDANADEIIQAYRADIHRLMQQYGFQSVDVVSLQPDHPKRAEMREKFLAEHIHNDFEVRFFVDGDGIFYIHAATQNAVFAVLCTAGDLISVPAKTTHWFDMGETPCFKAIRLFTTAEGWVADFTGNPIASQLPDYAKIKADLNI